MKCSDVYRHICEDLDGKLRTRRCREIRAHLDVCPDCRAYLTSLKRTVVLYRSLPTPRLPKGAHQRLLKAMIAQGCFPDAPRAVRHTRSPKARR
jgi:anti-sigma factor RsiW